MGRTPKMKKKTRKRARFSKAFVARKLAELSGRAISFSGSKRIEGSIGTYTSTLIGHIARLIGVYDEYRKELIRLIPELEPITERIDSEFEKRFIASEKGHRHAA
jgi:hypothetical protein